MSDMPLFDRNPEPGRMKSMNARRIEDLLAAQRGHLHPVSIRLLHSVTGISERAIKDAVAELIVEHNLPIGAHRTDPPGYFMIETAEDLDIALRPYRAQIHAMLRRMKSLEGRHRVREWLGQMAVEFD